MTTARQEAEQELPYTVGKDRAAELVAAAIAERDMQIVRWLGKKAREYRSTGSKQHALQADVIEVMASKITRGAVRDNNMRGAPSAPSAPSATPALSDDERDFLSWALDQAAGEMQLGSTSGGSEADRAALASLRKLAGGEQQ